MQHFIDQCYSFIKLSTTQHAQNLTIAKQDDLVAFRHPKDPLSIWRTS